MSLSPPSSPPPPRPLEKKPRPGRNRGCQENPLLFHPNEGSLVAPMPPPSLVPAACISPTRAGPASQHSQLCRGGPRPQDTRSPCARRPARAATALRGTADPSPSLLEALPRLHPHVASGPGSIPQHEGTSPQESPGVNSDTPEIWPQGSSASLRKEVGPHGGGCPASKGKCYWTPRRVAVRVSFPSE